MLLTMTNQSNFEWPLFERICKNGNEHKIILERKKN